jgi:hypothetical protein
MTQIIITKEYKLMKAGQTPMVDDAYAGKLIKAGFAKKVEPKK